METCWAFCQWENHQTIGSYGKIWVKHGTKWVMRGCSWDDLKIKKQGCSTCSTVPLSIAHPSFLNTPTDWHLNMESSGNPRFSSSQNDAKLAA
jgi:hypothetical protein